MKTNYFNQLINEKDLENLKYLEANKNYTILHFADGQKIESGYNLSKFQKMLAEKSAFKRMHRSYIVNMDYVKLVDLQAGFLKMESKEVFPISKNAMGNEDIEFNLN